MREAHQRTAGRLRAGIAMWSVLVLGLCGGCASPSEGGDEPPNGEPGCEAGVVWLDECLEAGADSDGDGLSNAVEAELATDPLSPDSDGDGLVDSYEVGVASAPTDTDGDGTIDALESRQNDADCDGVPDQEDPTHDPGPDGVTRVDTDGDGVADTCWVDTDGDGVADSADCEPNDPDIGDTCPSGPPCTETVCQPGSGCVVEPVLCDDDDLCTSDLCDETTSECHHVEVVCDTDLCTDDVCDPKTGACLIEDKDCTDDLECTIEETCDATTGECVNTEWDCDDGDPCTTDVCSLQSGLCESAPVLCDDLDPCTVDACDSVTGECIVTGAKCNTGSKCSLAACDPETGQCSYDAVECDDGDACTADLCDDQSGECVYQPKSCGDALPCTETVCEPATGDCDHVPIDCNDFDVCTVDSCDESTGECVHQSVTCSDILHCTEESCDPNVGCLYTPKECDDGDPCTTGSCQPEDGACVFTPVDCDDEDPCTVDTCDPDFGGACVHEVAACDDDDPCTEDVCVPESGDCLHTPTPAAILTLGNLETVTTGLALWNAEQDAPEGAGQGHVVSACGESPSAYFLASSEHGGIAPGSMGVALGLVAGALAGFEAHIATMGLGVDDLTLRLGLGSLGDDEEDTDWSYDASEGLETRHYQDVTLELWLADKPLMSSHLSVLTATVDHSTCASLPRPMTLQSDAAYAIDLTSAGSPATQLAAQLLLQSFGVPAKIQLALDVSTEDAVAFEAEGRAGHVMGSVTGTLSGVSCGEP